MTCALSSAERVSYGTGHQLAILPGHADHSFRPIPTARAKASRANGARRQHSELIDWFQFGLGNAWAITKLNPHV